MSAWGDPPRDKRLDAASLELVRFWTEKRGVEDRDGSKVWQSNVCLDTRDTNRFQDLIRKMREAVTGTAFEYFNPTAETNPTEPAPPVDPLRQRAEQEAKDRGYTSQMEGRPNFLEGFKVGHDAALGSLAERIADAIKKLTP